MRKLNDLDVCVVKRWILASVVLVSTSLAFQTGVREARAAPILFSEPFTGRTTTNWVGGGSDAACLTAGFESGSVLGCVGGVSGGVTGILPDPNNDGALRLTNSKERQAGYVIYNTSIPTANGLDISFDYFSYGGSGGDGLSFVLIDGNANPSVPGGAGGSLGYAPLVYPPMGINQPGIAGGYLAIGFDEFGNFVNSLEGRNVGCPSSPYASLLSPNTVSVRGAAGVGGTISQLPAYQGYCLLQTSGTLTQSLSAPDLIRSNAIVRHVRIVLDVNSNLCIFIDFGAGYQLVMPALNLAAITTQPHIPSGVKLAFAGSTGGSTNNHEVRNLVVRADRTGVRIAKSHIGEFANGQPGTYRLEVTNNGTLATIPGTPVLVTDTLPVGLTYAAGSCAGGGWVCSGSGSVMTASYTPGVSDTIAAGATLPLLTFNVNTDSAQAVVTNTAVATMQFPSGSDSDSVSDITFVRAPDLDVSMALFPKTPLIGKLVTFTADLKNAGSYSATNVQISFVLTGPLTVQSATATGGGATWTCATTPEIRCTTPSFGLPGNARIAVSALVAETADEGTIVTAQATTSTATREIGSGAIGASASGSVRLRWPAFLPVVTRDAE